MNRVFPYVVALFVLTAVQCQSEDANLGKLADDALTACKEPNASANKRQAAIAKALNFIVPLLGAESEAARKDPQHQLDRMEFAVSRPGADRERVAYCNAIVEELEKDLATPAKIWLLKSLERVGDKESVAMEAMYLTATDETVRETARRALALNPDEEAAAELRKALTKATDPKVHAALIEALGFKRNKADIPIFEKDAQDADPGVKAAALAALAAQGVRKEPKTLEEAAQLIDMGRASQQADIPKLVAALDSPNIKIRQAAVQAVNLNTSPEMTTALVKKLKAESNESVATATMVLGQRGDKSAFMAVLPGLSAGLKNNDPAVLGTSIQAVGLLGDGSAVPFLMALALRGEGDAPRLARDSLDRLRGADVDRELIALLDKDGVEGAKETVARLAARNATSAVPKISILAKTATNRSVRLEALKALGTLGGKETLSLLLTELIGMDEETVRDQIAKSIVAIAKRMPEGDGRAEPIVAALATAPEPARIALLSALSQLGGAKASEAVHTAMKDPSEKTQEAAFRALASWPDATPMNELLDIARTVKNETHRVLALRGFVRLAALPSNRAPRDTLTIFEGALDAAKTPGDKKLLLSAMADIKHPDVVLACAKFIGDADVKEEACVAVVKAAKALENSRNEKWVPALKEVQAQTKSNATKDQAKAILDKLEKK